MDTLTLKVLLKTERPNLPRTWGSRRDVHQLAMIS